MKLLLSLVLTLGLLGATLPVEAVCLNCDQTGNGTVRIADVIAVVAHYGEEIEWCRPPHPEATFVVNPDLNSDGYVRIADVRIIINAYGQPASTCGVL